MSYECDLRAPGKSADASIAFEQVAPGHRPVRYPSAGITGLAGIDSGPGRRPSEPAMSPHPLRAPCFVLRFPERPIRSRGTNRLETLPVGIEVADLEQGIPGKLQRPGNEELFFRGPVEDPQHFSLGTCTETDWYKFV